MILKHFNEPKQCYIIFFHKIELVKSKLWINETYDAWNMTNALNVEFAWWINSILPHQKLWKRYLME